MQATLSMRRVRAADAELVAAHGVHQPGEEARRVALAAWLRPRIDRGTYLGQLAFDASGIVGGAGAVLLDWGPTRANPGGLMARINNVFVDPRHRRRGIGRMLLAAVMADCEAHGVREFNLGATADARALYESLGFVAYPAEMRRRVAP